MAKHLVNRPTCFLDTQIARGNTHANHADTNETQHQLVPPSYVWRILSIPLVMRDNTVVILLS